MPSNETEDQKLSAQANELYWQSGRSVNQIAEDMDLSKSRLYGLVKPLPEGSPCPECRSDLVFPNRTAMEKGFVSCSSCSYEGTAVDVPAETKTGNRPKRGSKRGSKRETKRAAKSAAPAAAGNQAPDSQTRRAAARAALGSKRVLYGSALLGLAAGLYVAIRHRRS